MAKQTRSFDSSDGVKVFVNERGNVVIRCDYDCGGPVEMLIEIPPDRVDLVCQWLQECKAEASRTVDQTVG